MASRINWAPLIAQQASRNQRRQETAYSMGDELSDGIHNLINSFNNRKDVYDENQGGWVSEGKSDDYDWDTQEGESKERFNLLSTLFPNKGAKYTDQEGLFRGGQKFNPNIGEDVDGDGKPDGGFEADNRFLGRVRDIGDTAYDLAAKGGPQYIKQGLQNLASLPAQFKSGLEGIGDSQTKEEYWQSQESMEPQRKKGLFDFLKDKQGESYDISGYDFNNNISGDSQNMSLLDLQDKLYWNKKNEGSYDNESINNSINKPVFLDQNEQGYEMLLDDGTSQFFKWGDPNGPIKENPYDANNDNLEPPSNPMPLNIPQNRIPGMNF